MKRRIVRPVLVAVLALTFGTGGTAFAVDDDGAAALPDKIAVEDSAGTGDEVVAPVDPEAPPAAADPLPPPIAEVDPPADAGEERPAAADSGSPVEGGDEVPGLGEGEGGTSDPGVESIGPMSVVVEAATGTIGEPRIDGCVVTIPTTTTGTGPFSIEIWDDGVMVDMISWEMTEDGTHDALWTVTMPAGEGSAGVAISLYHDSDRLDAPLRFSYPPEVVDACAEAAAVTVELPDYDPDAGTEAGTELAIAGAGFAPGETVTAWFDIEGSVVGTYAAAGESVPSALPAATFRAGDPGTFSGTFVVPFDAEPGEHTIYVGGEDSGRSASAGLIVLAAPEPEPEPVTGEIGEITRDSCLVTIPTITTGAGEFTLRVWDDGSVVDSFTWVMADDGSHTVLWTITRPAGSSAPGVGIELVDANGNRLDYIDPFVYPDDVADSCSAAVPVEVDLPDYNPATGTQPGSDLTITGTGFLPGEEVEVTFGDGGPVVGTFTVDEDGTFSGTFTVPEDAEDGDHPVVATGVESGRSGSQSVRVGEEPKPVPITGTIGDITRDGCVVTIPTTTTGAGEFTLDVWDDGEKIDSFTWKMTGDGNHDVLWTITRPAGKSAVGVGFVLSGSSGSLDSVDPWEYPAEVAYVCSGGLPDPVEPHPVAPAAATSMPTQPVLAKTGSSNVDSMLLLGVGLLLVGAGGVVARRGRRSK